MYLGREWSGRQDSNLRHPPWKGGALPTELRPHRKLTWLEKWWREKDSNLRRITPTDLQSVAIGHSATSPHIPALTYKIDGADYRNRTYDRRFTKPMLYQLS